MTHICPARPAWPAPLCRATAPFASWTRQKARKDERHNFFKCNAKGQPLMRYRMEKLLAKIQQDQ